MLVPVLGARALGLCSRRVGVAAGWRGRPRVAVVLASLGAAGYLAARCGAAPTGRAALRNLAVGALTMGVTYALGALTHTLL